MKITQEQKEKTHVLGFELESKRKNIEDQWAQLCDMFYFMFRELEKGQEPVGITEIAIQAAQLEHFLTGKYEIIDKFCRMFEIPDNDFVLASLNEGLKNGLER